MRGFEIRLLIAVLRSVIMEIIMKKFPIKNRSRSSFIIFLFSVLVVAGSFALGTGEEELDVSSRYDVVVVGATPGGIMASIAVGRMGCSVVLLERSGHIGGLPANGLGATDIATRGATGGLFREFVQRIRRHYEDTYG